MQLLHQELGALRDKTTLMVGKNLIFTDILVPGNSRNGVSDVRLNTQNEILLASQVEVYPFLQPGTLHKSRFDDSDRNPDEVFAFQTRGAPHISIILPNHPNAIAVIKKYINQKGDEVTLAAALETLGLDRSQFGAFVRVVDGMSITRCNAQVQLAAVVELENVGHVLTENSKKGIANLDSVICLDSDTRTRVCGLLPALIQKRQHTYPLHP